MIRDIVVHLTGSKEDAYRLECAEKLADRLEAHVSGLLMHVEPEIITMPDVAYAGVLQEVLAEAESITEKRKAALAERFAAMAFPNDLRVVRGWRNTVGSELAAEARTADLFVGTRPYGDPKREEDIEERVLFESGCPCLLLPPGGAVPLGFDTVMVAWKNTRECARATRDSIPFLKLARRVYVVMAREDEEDRTHIPSGAGVARYLSRHGVSVELREISAGFSAETAIFGEAKATSTQLLVAGAYGHSRLQERLLGGVTRTLLSECEVPVFLSR